MTLAGLALKLAPNPGAGALRVAGCPSAKPIAVVEAQSSPKAVDVVLIQIAKSFHCSAIRKLTFRAICCLH